MISINDIIRWLYTNGVLAAKAAGMKCIGFQNKNSGDQDLSNADLIISNYENLTIEDMKNLFN